MHPRAQRLVTGTERWFQWVNVQAVRYDDAGKSFDEFAQDHYASSDAYRELLATHPSRTTSATHEAFANTACAWALLTEDAIGRRGGDLDYYVDPVQVLDPEERIVLRRSTPEVGVACEPLATGAAQPEVTHPHDFPTTGSRP